MGLEAFAYNNDDEREAELAPSPPARILSLEAVGYGFMDLGIVLLENANLVDFYRLAKRGPVHASYGEFFRNMTEAQWHALKEVFASGRFTAMEMFKAFTHGTPPPDVLIPVK